MPHRFMAQQKHKFFSCKYSTYVCQITVHFKQNNELEINAIKQLTEKLDWIGLDWAVFYVPPPAPNTVYVIWDTVFTGQKTQPTVSKY